MALLFVDSFDHYGTDELPRKWDNVEGATIVAGQGRCGTQAMFITTSPAIHGAIKGVQATGPTVIVGMAVKIPSTHGNDAVLVTVMAGSTPTFQYRHQSDGSIKGIVNPDAAFPDTAFLTGGGLLPKDEYHFLEIKHTMHASAGTVDIQIDGVLVYSGTGLETSVDGTTWTGVIVGDRNFAYTMYVDDFYIADTSGTTNNDFLGDIRIEALQPVSDGTTQEWDLGAGASHWEAVDDGVEPDDDTSYVSTSTLNEIELNNHEDSALPVGSSIKGVQVTILAKKDEPSDRTIAPVVRLSSTNYVGSSLGLTEDTYSFVHGIFEVSPDTDAAWTVEEINNAEYGVKLTN